MLHQIFILHQQIKKKKKKSAFILWKTIYTQENNNPICINATEDNWFFHPKERIYLETITSDHYQTLTDIL
jgi:hypothetical protein